MSISIHIASSSSPCTPSTTSWLHDSYLLDNTPNPTLHRLWGFKLYSSHVCDKCLILWAVCPSPWILVLKNNFTRCGILVLHVSLFSLIWSHSIFSGFLFFCFSFFLLFFLIFFFLSYLWSFFPYLSFVSFYSPRRFEKFSVCVTDPQHFNYNVIAWFPLITSKRCVIL